MHHHRTGASRPWSAATLFLLVLAGAVGIAGCGEDASSGKDLQVSNVPDSFQFQVTDVKHYSHTYRYTWVNSGTTATVNQASSITEGSTTLLVKDATGAMVYGQSLKVNGTDSSTAGVAGDWTIEVLLNKASGTINFRVEKP